MTSQHTTHERQPRTLSRRRFAALAPAAAAIAGTLPRAVAQTPAAMPASFSEAPMLAELVQAGTLPPLAERLPPEPLVVTTKNAIGTYGGTFFGASMAPETTSDFQLGMVTGLFRFSNDLSEVSPEVASGYEFNDDYTSCTITLRQGIKWSDGEPFTADDMMFYFEDWQFDTDVQPTVAGQWVVGGERIGVEKVDDHTVTFTFAVPNPAFNLLNYSGAPAEPWRARHYLEQFHIKYNPDVETAATEAGYDSWQLYFLAQSAATTYNYGAQNPDLPVLGPWKPVSNDTQRQQYERNPYYFKVDTEGNQLPYVDRVVIDYAGDPEVMNLRAVSGELSVAGLDLQLINYPVIREGEGAGDYTTTLVYSERGSDVALAFNQEHPDPVLHELFRDVRFRQAMSLAINREEINEIVFLGQGTIRQATINESASFFKPEWADHYVAFDLEQTNSLLDELGLDQRDGSGNRLRSDGEPLSFQLEYLPQEGPKAEVCDLVVRHWAELGIQVQAAARERNFLLERIDAGEQDATGWHVDRQLERAAWTYRASSKISPGGDSIIRYAKAWRDWFATGGESGIEPPEEAQSLATAFDDWQKTVMGTPEYTEAATRVHDQVAEVLYVIGVIGQAPQPVIVKNNVENVFTGSEERIWWGAANWFWHTHHPEQWFLTS
jgi:peptide/nickel transport system substrate-binding protein